MVGTAGANADGEYRAVAEGYLDPLFHTSDGLMRWIGPSVETTLGWSPDELMATSLSALCHPDDRADLAALLRRVEDGQPGRGVVRLRSKPGVHVWVLLSVAAGVVEGQVGAVGSIREINRRVHAEQQLVVIAERASNVVFTSGPDHRVMWTSTNITRILGWSPGDLVGRDIADFTHPDDAGALRDLLRPFYDGGDPYPRTEPLVVRVRDCDGAPRWMEASASTLRDVDGSVAGVVGSLLDVDDLVRAQDRIRADAIRLRTVLDTMLDAHAVLVPVRGDAGIEDFTFADVNEAACRYLGLPAEEIIGTRITDRMPGNRTVGLMAQYAAAMESGEPLVIDDLLYPAFELSGTDRHFEVRAVRFDDALSLIWRDVTEQRETVAALSASEEQYRLLAENSSDVVLRRRAGTVLWASPSLTAMLGWAPREWVGMRFDDVVHPDDVASLSVDDMRIGGGAHVVRRFRLRDREGAFHWVESHAAPYRDGQGQIDGIVASFRTVDEDVAREEELDHRARFDELTGLLNRKEILDRIAGLGEHARRTGSESAVLFCDVDHFKAVNDDFGHVVGDAVLREIARRVGTCIRRRDLAARVGGDELLVVLDGVHGLPDALVIAEKIRAEVARPIPIDDRTVDTTVSIGVCLVVPGESLDALVARADDAMFQAKARGRDRVVAIEAP